MALSWLCEGQTARIPPAFSPKERCVKRVDDRILRASSRIWTGWLSVQRAAKQGGPFSCRGLQSEAGLKHLGIILFLSLVGLSSPQNAQAQRMISHQVVDALRDRLAARPAAGLQVTVLERPSPTPRPWWRTKGSYPRPWALR